MIPGLVERLRLQWTYLRCLGRLPNLKKPQRFTEKIQVAKLYWRDPSMRIMADKIAAKEYVASELGRDWVTPNLYAGDRLPPVSQRIWKPPYVIKASHRSNANIFVLPAGGNDNQVICTDRNRQPLFGGSPQATPDWRQVDALLDKWLRSSFGKRRLEWAYRNIPQRVLVEPFLGSPDPPVDYKLFVFAGRVELIDVVLARFQSHRHVFLDRQWNFVELSEPKRQGDPQFAVKPKRLEQMIEAAEFLARGFPFLRFDLYEIDDRPRFSEFTFYPWSGIVNLEPPEADLKLGALWPDAPPAVSPLKQDANLSRCA